jgi:ABC-type amino acid transport substrate-binding protein
LQEEKVLRHLGINYANFVTVNDEGFCVEMIKMFSEYLGIGYELVRSDWDRIILDLTGTATSLPKGDLISTGMTVLPSRSAIIDFSDSIFPTQVWLISKESSIPDPIKPSASFSKEIKQTKLAMKDMKILVKRGTSLDPAQYGLDNQGLDFIYFDGSVDEIAPAILSGYADAGFVDVADALIALTRWPDKLKVIGPVSEKQEIAVGFPKQAQELRGKFNKFLALIRKDGRYMQLVEKYYPFIIDYYPEYFKSW